MPENHRETAPEPSRGKTKTATSVANKFSVAIAALVVLCMCVFWLISNYTIQNLLHQQADSLGMKLAVQAAALITEPVLANDAISINVLLNQLTRDSVIAEAAIHNVDGGVIARSVNDRSATRPLLPVRPAFGDYRAPIALRDSIAGEVRIRLDLTYIENGVLSSFIFLVAATAVLALIAILLCNSYFHYLIIFPLRHMAFSLQRIRRGDIEALPRPETNNEVSTVVRQFNATADFLARNTFLSSLQFKLQAAAKEEASPRPPLSRIDATVLCIRIANFHYLSSTQDEKTMVRLLSRFYFFAENIGQLYNGTIASCSDGEVIIGFTSAQLEDEQCFYAICAGQLLLHMQASIADLGLPDGALNFKIKIAVHFGDITSGLYSPMTNATDNVNGKTVDLARLICDDCPDNSLLVSESAYHQAGADSRVDGGEFSIVGDERQIITYLCNLPMTGIIQLLERQSSQLLKLYEGSKVSA